MESRFNPLAAGNAAAPDASHAADTLPAPAANPASATGGQHDDAYRAKATEAAVKFESFFIGTMLHKMRESARSVGDRDKQEDSINSDMLDMADNMVADQLAQRRAFGIADSILRQLLPVSPPAHPVQTASPPANSAQATTITKNLAADT